MIIFKLAVQGIIMVVSISTSLQILSNAIIAVEVLYIIMIIMSRPYRSIFMNLGAIVCSCTTIYAYCLPILISIASPA